MITEAERKAWRADHFRKAEFCFVCGIQYPCEVIRLLDALDTADAERERLQRILLKCRQFVPKGTLREEVEAALEAER